MARRKRPFARVETWSTGHYAVNRSSGMASGPWESPVKAAEVADAWNKATNTI